MKYGSYGIDTKSLKELFNSKEFTLPLYQRDYSWQKPQFDSFRESLEELMVPDEHYEDSRTTMFLSQFVFADSPSLTQAIMGRRQDDPRIQAKIGLLEKAEGLEIVDGQQRLTTIHIVIHCMLSKVNQEYHKINKTNKIHTEPSTPVQRCLNQVGKINKWFLKQENIIDHFCENKKLCEKTRLFPDIHKDVWNLIFDSGLEFKAKRTKWNKMVKDTRANGYYENSDGDQGRLKSGDRALWNSYAYFTAFFDDYDIENYTPIKTDQFIHLWERLLVNAGGEDTAAHSTELIAKRFDDGVFIFNALNTKNKQLSAADLVKMHAYELCMKSSDSLVRSDKAEEFMIQFNELESNESLSQTDSNLVNYLRVYLVSKHGRKVKNISTERYITIANSTLYKAYQSSIRDVKEMQEAFRELKRLVPIYEMIKTKKTHKIENIGQKRGYKKLAKTVKRMNVLLPALSTFDHILLHAFNKFRDRSSTDHYTYDENIDELQKIMDTIYRFSVRHYTICNERANIVMTALDKDHNKLIGASDIDTFYETLCETLKSIQPTQAVFLESFKDFSEEENTKSIIMLWEIEESLTADHNDTSKFQCEHIFPRNGHDKWREDYDKKFSHSETTINNLMQKRYYLGNLTLLMEEDNNTLGDKPIDEKLPYYLEGKGGYRLGIYELFSKAFEENNKEWIDSSVDKLQSLYAAELEKIFKV